MFLCFLFSVCFVGCAKEEAKQEQINSSSEGADFGKEEASSEEKQQSENASSREEDKKESGQDEQEGEIINLNQGINGEVFVKLKELEELAVQYKQENGTVEDSASLLVAKYLRASNASYQSESWNMLAGTPSEEFEAYIVSNANEELQSFRDNAALIDPATGNTIEFSHLMASVNLAIRQEELGSEDMPAIDPYVDYGSWGGDLLQLCTEIKDSGISSDQWKDEMVSRIGNDNSSFNRDDLYADLDACNMYTFFERGMGLSETFYRYYYDVLEKSEETRIQYFYNKYFGGVQEGLADKMKAIIQDEESVIMQILINTQNLDAVEDASLIATACEAFAQKIIENK